MEKNGLDDDTLGENGRLRRKLLKLVLPSVCLIGGSGGYYILKKRPSNKTGN